MKEELPRAMETQNTFESHLSQAMNTMSQEHGREKLELYEEWHDGLWEPLLHVASKGG